MAGLDLRAAITDAARRGPDEAEKHARQGGLAAARLADQTERLALAEVEADVVDRLDFADLAAEDQALQDRVVLAEALGREDHLSGHRCPPGWHEPSRPPHDAERLLPAAARRSCRFPA